MNRFFQSIIFAGAATALSSCYTKENKESLYYPVDSLINAQVEYLKQSKALLSKSAEIDGIEETSSFTPKDSTAWANELDIFAELNVINSLGSAKSYVVESGIKDPNSNLSIRSFTGMGTLPVVYLKVFYLEIPSRIRRIESLYQEENSLVKGSRLLILEFQEINKKIVLTSYSIEGSQKMFLGESVKFSIKGTITLP
jgi:hypothetical protein